VWMDPALLTGPLPAGVQGAGGGDGAAQGKVGGSALGCLLNVGCESPGIPSFMLVRGRLASQKHLVKLFPYLACKNWICMM
jgi:hypothetical protein